MTMEFDAIILGGGKGGKTLAMDLAKWATYRYG